MACAAACEAVGKRLGVPAVTGLNEGNPAVEIYRSRLPIVPCGQSAAGMRQALSEVAAVALRLAQGLALLPGTCFPRGVRVPVWREKSGADRAVEMLLARLGGRKPASELPLPSFEKVPPAPPLADLSKAVIVLATEGGLAPKGNPDRIEMSMATRFGRYPIEGLDHFDASLFDVAHGGYDNTAAREVPDRLLPLDAMWELERRGVIGALAPFFYTTAGNATSVENATRFGKAIAKDLRERIPGAVGVLLTAT